MKNGTQWFVYKEVGKYQCKEQFDALYDLMTKMGWLYESNGTDEFNGTWYKPGFKDKDKNFYIVSHYISHTAKTKRHRGVNVMANKSKLDEFKYEILEKREQGYTFNDLADIYNCSHAGIRNFYNKIKNDKK